MDNTAKPTGGGGAVDLSRRDVLAASAAAASLAALPHAAHAQQAIGQPLLGNPVLPDGLADRMRWAIVGLGTFAVGQVIPGFGNARRSRITAFVSGNPQKARALGEAYGVARFYDYAGYDEIAQDEEIDCIYIALPVGLHAEYAIRALEAGKHVLCEKPMCVSVSQAKAMVAAARASNRQLGVAYRVHFEPNNRDTLRRISAGELGTIRHVSADHGFDANPAYPPHKWRLEKALAGGGSLFDIGIYGINTSLLMLPGDRIVSITAHYSTPADDDRFDEVEGGVDYRLRMASGINVQGSSSYCWNPYVSRQRYFGSTASIEMQPATTYGDIRTVLEGGGLPARELRAGNPAIQFAAQVDGFSEAARANRPHLTPGEMGLRDMQIMESIYTSANSDGAMVAVDIAV